MREAHVSLDEEDFKILVAGGIVRKESAGGHVAISLQDIGMGRMVSALSEAVNVRSAKIQNADLL